MTVSDYIPAGTYKLTQEVANPKPDRRIKRDWREHAVWPAGSMFLVEDYTVEFNDKTVVDSTIRLIGDQWSGHRLGYHSSPERWAALLPHLTKVDETTSGLLARLDVAHMSGYLFCKFLAKKLGHAGLEALWIEWMEQPEDTE